MKRSLKLKRIAVLWALAGILIAAVWLITCLIVGMGLLMNGPWLIAISLLVGSTVFSFAAMFAEDSEWHEDDQERR